jgi:hypothetical protein
MPWNVWVTLPAVMNIHDAPDHGAGARQFEADAA